MNYETTLGVVEDEQFFELTSGLFQKDSCKRIPGMRVVDGTTWRAPVSWSAACAIAKEFPQIKLDDSARAYTQRVHSEFVSIAYRLATVMDQPTVGPVPYFRGTTKYDLFGFQEAGVEYLRTVQRAGLFDPMGTGKAQRLMEPVQTPTGPKPIGSLVIGSEVLCPDGTVAKVTGVFPQGKIPIYRIDFSGGASVRASGDHLWNTQTLRERESGKWSVKTTDEIAATVRYTSSRGGRNHALRPVTAYAGTDADLLIDPWVLGIILGDGGLTGHSVRVSTPDTEIVERLEFSYEIGSVDGIGHTLLGAVKDTKTLGIHGTLSVDKAIPEQYMRASSRQRLQLLRGLMDTDGHHGSGKSPGSEFSSSSKVLVEQVQWIVESLGGHAALSVKESPTYTHNGEKRVGHEAYRLHILMPQDMCPFWTPRKAEPWYETNENRQRKELRRWIESVTYESDEEAVCISIDHPEREYLTTHFVPTHNTAQTISALRALEKAFLLSVPDRLNEIVSPYPALIVAPNSVKASWMDEFELWYPEAERKNVINFGNNAKDRKLAIERMLDPDDPGDVLVANWEGLYNNSRHAGYGSIKVSSGNRVDGPLNKVDWNTVVADEAHRAKNPDAKQTRALWYLRQNAKYRYALTGTPMANTPEDLWALLYLLWPEEFPSKSKFIDRYCIVGYGDWGGIDVLGLDPASREEFDQVTRHLWRRTPKKIALPSLPDKVYTTHHCEMKPAQKKMYKQMQETMIAEIEETGDVIVATNALARMTRLLQFASATGTYDAETNEVNLKSPSCKVDALFAILEDIPDTDQLVVFAQSRKLIELCQQHFDKMVKGKKTSTATRRKFSYGMITGRQSPDERANNVKAFQAGEMRVMLCTLAAGGVGITLTAANTMVFLQRSFSIIDNSQAEDRCVLDGEMVHTLRGYVPIEDVVIGDQVLTHLGNWKRVYGTERRNAKSRPLTDITYRGSNLPLRCTSDHRVLVKRESGPEWVEASTLLPGDRMLFHHATPGSGASIDVKHLDSTFVNNSGAEQRNGRLNVLPVNSVSLDGDAAYMLGFYLGNGMASVRGGKGSYVSFASADAKDDRLIPIRRLMDDLGVSHTTRHGKCDNGIEMRSYSIELAQTMVEVVGTGSRGKNIGKLLPHLTRGQAQAILDGYIAADGYERKNQREWVSVCATLASQMAIVASIAGWSPTLRHVVNDHNDCWVGCITATLPLTDGYREQVVSRVETYRDKTAYVNDLSVEDDHSFTVGMVNVHNCHRIGSEIHDSVNIIDVISDGTLDVHVRAVSKTKAESLEDLIRDGDRLRHLLAGDIIDLPQDKPGDDT